MNVENLGLMSYPAALSLMEERHREKASYFSTPDVLLVVEHPPTVTMGNRNLVHDLLVSPAELKYKGVHYHKVDRGGSVTVHEPGQIVIYPIVNLYEKKMGVRFFVESLENAMIDLCLRYGVNATRDPIGPGIWVGSNKLGAVGIRVLNKVTKHGLAFNLCNSLETFSHIVPCGLHGRGVTSLQRETQIPFFAENLKIELATLVSQYLECGEVN